MAEAAYLFGAVGIGIQVPQTAETEFGEHKMWSYYPGSPNVGGHYVPIVAHRKHIECVTWGRVQPMGDALRSHYIDEAWAIVNPDFLDVRGQSPAGFDMAQLLADLAQLAGGPSLAVVQPGRLTAGEPRRPSRACAVVQDHVHGHAREQVGEAALVVQRVQERALAQLGQDPRRDPAADVDAARGEQLEREVARLGAVDLDHHVERAHAHRVAARERRRW